MSLQCFDDGQRRRNVVRQPRSVTPISWRSRIGICATRRSSGCEAMLNLAEYRKKPQRLAPKRYAAMAVAE